MDEFCTIIELEIIESNEWKQLELIQQISFPITQATSMITNFNRVN